jgi:outer membrane murein-binding lipoprotein Lpp
VNGGAVKKTVVFFLVFLLAVLAISLAGCGESEKSEQASDFERLRAEAEELRVTADASWDSLYERIEASNRNTQNLIMAALAGDTSSLTPEQTTGIAENASSLATEAEQVKADYQAMVKPEYEKYEGVSAYANYGRGMITAIDAYQSLLQSGAVFLAKVEPLLASGDTAGLQSLIQQSSEEVTTLQEEQAAAAEALEEAQDIKSFEKLGE